MSIKPWKIKIVKLDEIKPMPDNPRAISDSALAALEFSIKRFGYVEPIVWNKTTGHIVGGHQRFSILKEQGVSELTVVVVELEKDIEFSANMTLNNPKIEGAWDDPISSLLDQIEQKDETLFESLRLDKLKEAFGTGEFTLPVEKEPTIEVEGDGGISDKVEFDTECPCCKHGWDIQPNDVVVE